MQQYKFIPEFMAEWPSKSDQSLRWFIRKNEGALKNNKAIIRLGNRNGINSDRFWETVNQLQEDMRGAA